MFMKKVMLHVSISMLLVTSATVYSSQSSNPKSESYVSSASETGSTHRMSAAHLNVPSHLHSDTHDQIIDSRSASPRIDSRNHFPLSCSPNADLSRSPNVERHSRKNSTLDLEALRTALKERKKKKKQEQIAKNCAHMFGSDDEGEIARKGIELLNSVFSDTETPADTPRNPSPIRTQSSNPEIKIFPASGNATPDKQLSPKISPRKKLSDSSDKKILDDVAASSNVTSPSDTSPKDPVNSPEIPLTDQSNQQSAGASQEELNNLLEELQNKDASTKEKQTTATDQEIIDQEILELTKNPNKAWKENIKKVAEAKNNLKKSEETKTPPPSFKRSRWIIGSMCILAMAVALFYAQKVWWSTPEKTV